VLAFSELRKGQLLAKLADGSGRSPLAREFNLVNAGPVARPGLNDLDGGEPGDRVQRTNPPANDFPKLIPFVILDELAVNAGASRPIGDPLIELFHRIPP